jgi:hypothetical protein
MDNIFINNSWVNSFEVSRVINGLSDQDKQYLIFRNAFVFNKYSNSISRIRLITKDSLTNFINMLKNESWDDAFFQNDINSFLNSFLLFLNLALVGPDCTSIS